MFGSRALKGASSFGRIITQLTGAVFVLVGAVLTAGGAWLLKLGGSPYYVLAGLGLIACGVLLVLRRRLALIVYAIVLIASLIWALAEVGLDWWPLAARGDVLFPMGLWIAMPWVANSLTSGANGVVSKLETRAPVFLLSGLGLAVVLLVAGVISDTHDLDGSISSPSAVAPMAELASGQPDEDWRSYGRTEAGQRYSPIGQITPANVNKLKVAWTFRTGDGPRPEDPYPVAFEVTPLKVGNTLYLCSQHQKLFALDAQSGKLNWSFDPQVQDDQTFQHLTCRGVTYHEDPPSAVLHLCAKAVFLPVNDGRLIARDAITGAACPAFGDHGTLNLQRDLGDQTKGFYELTSPPVVSDSVLVVAGAVTDNYSTHEPSGVVRGFDIHSGRLVWAWDAGAQNENRIASDKTGFTKNSPNSWMTASYDPKLGLIYLPMGVQTPDIFGGNRTAESERYSSSLVALDIKTGRRVWSYQTVHHDIWDMDVPSQPSLVDINTASGIVPAVIQPTKMGDIFVLDRRDGRPVVPAPETPVPGRAVSGDHTSPTQPFSQLTFRPKKPLTGADMWGVTIFDQLACRVKFQSLRYEGPFTPPSLQGTLVYPGNLGMFEWGGVAVDPVRQVVIANPISVPYVSKLYLRGAQNPPAPDAAHPPRSEGSIQPMYGTPYGVDLHPLMSPLHLPCLRPPWGYIAGVDLKTMKIAWQHVNGTTRDTVPLPISFKMGVPSLGGPIVTAGGLAFLTSTTDDYIRAYDVKDGRQLWQSRLPAGGQSTPMSYAIGGRQYVVTADGGDRGFSKKLGDYVVAYALP